MKIVIFGGTGRTGKHVVRLAVKQQFEVTVLARKPESVPKDLGLRIIQGDVLDLPDVRKAIEGQDAVVCVLGPTSRTDGPMQSKATANLITAMKAAQVSRLIIQTSVEVGDSRGQGGILFGKLVLPLLLKDVFDHKEVQEKLTKESGLQWTIVRPTGLTDGQGVGLKQINISTDGRKVPLRIARVDVASFILDELRSSRYLHQSPTIGTHRGLLGF